MSSESSSSSSCEAELLCSISDTVGFVTVGGHCVPELFVARIRPLPELLFGGTTWLSMPELPSFVENIYSLISPILLPGLVLRRSCSPSTLAGLSASPQGMPSIPSLFLEGLV